MDTVEEDILPDKGDGIESTHNDVSDDNSLLANRTAEATLHDTPKEPKLTMQTRGSQTDPPPEFPIEEEQTSKDVEEFDQEREEFDNQDDDEEEDVADAVVFVDDDDDDDDDVVKEIGNEVEKEIEHFPQIVNHFIETDTASEISLQVPKVTITDRIRNLSSTSQTSLKFWQNPQNSELRGHINATRLHPKCFSQLHLANISRKLTKGRYEQGNTTTPAGVKTLIFWSQDRRRPADKTTLESTSQVWSSRLNMHTRSDGKPVHNLESINGTSHRTPKRTKSNTCQCLRFADHHNTCPRSNWQKSQTAKYPGKQFFQTEIREDGDNINGTNSFIRKLEILNSNLEPQGELSVFPRNNTPVGLLSQQLHPEISVRRERSVPLFSSYKLGRLHPHLVKSMDSFHSPCSRPSPGLLPNPTSATSHSLSRHPHHVPSIHTNKPRRQTPQQDNKNFEVVIRGANNLLYTDSV